MKTLHSCEPEFKGGKSIFLVGPTPRRSDVPSWRPEAIELLRAMGFDGTVLVPEHKKQFYSNYEDQVEWEYAGLLQATVIVAWVPREMDAMPALTTNVEFGYWLSRSPERLLYGRPNWAVHTRYLDWMYKTFVGREPHDNLDDLLKDAVLRTG